MKKRLIIFSDYGLDDACALVYLLGHADRFDGIDVVCIAGNVPAERSLSNAHKLLAQADSGQWTVDRKGEGRFSISPTASFSPSTPVRLVSTDDFPQKHVFLPSIHGKDGMGDLFSASAKTDAIPYAQWFNSLPESAVILSLGPCTVSLDVIKRFKSVKGAEHVMMAGVVGAEPNYLGMEFNQALDPESLAAQVKFPHKIATLDTCRVRQFNLAGEKIRGGSLLCRLVNRAKELKDARHSDNSYVYDLIAALYLVEPQIFKARVAVDPWGNRLSELAIADEKFSLGEYLAEHNY
ncbi:MAG: nucleoside hydrolase [Firmicutes bacterium]|nr:nucleoside hydrolase [Bacillota bacterium]